MVKHKDWIRTKIFEEQWEFEHLNNVDEHDHRVYKQGKKIPKYPTIEWVNAKSTNSSKDSITNNDVTSYVNIAKYVDTASADEHNREVYTDIVSDTVIPLVLNAGREEAVEIETAVNQVLNVLETELVLDIVSDTTAVIPLVLNTGREEAV